ncbi:DUF2207 domain-containing protein [Cryobacterium sp. TMT2-42-4]|nr:DUF2207 domain-containing protein [Cryobacterium sp. TMT2-42-4]
MLWGQHGSARSTPHRGARLRQKQGSDSMHEIAPTGHPLRRFVQVIAALAVAVAAALALGMSAVGMPLAASADTGDFTFTSFEADYYLSRDDAGHSTLRTVETFVAQFPNFDQNRGMVRLLPNDYNGVPLNTTVESVTDATGAPVNFETTDQGSVTEVPLGTDEFVRGQQTYTITYTQQNVVRAFADTDDDELYWDTNGTGFDQSFGSVTARVHVDPSIAEFLTGDTACYSGAQDDGARCEISQTTDAAVPGSTGQLFTSSVQGLGPRQNLTVAIGFAPGTFVPVPASASDGASDSDNGGGGPATGLLFLVAAVGFLGVVLAFIRRRLGQRDARGRGTIIAQYSVPKGYNLLEAGDLANRSKSAIAAELVSLAVRGTVRILDYPVSAGGGDYTLQLLTVEGVDGQERKLLETLFPRLTIGATRELGVADSALAAKLSAFLPAATASVIERGWRAKVAGRGGRWIAIGMAVVLLPALAVLGAVALIDGSPKFGEVMTVAVIAALFLYLALYLAQGTVQLTDSGADQRDYLKGLKVYLKLAEEERFRMLQSPDGALRGTTPAVPGVASGALPSPGTDAAGAPDTVELVKLYEELLPFAVLWGVERDWAKELVVLYEHGAPEPGWIVSQGGFSASGFGVAMNGWVASVLTSATVPVSSSSGGGYSGGGGGGGR